MADLPDASPAVAVHESLADAIHDCSIVFWCLSDDKAEKSLVDQLVQLDIKDILFVDCSTVHPDTTSETDTKLQSKGAKFLAMPVFGAVSISFP